MEMIKVDIDEDEWYPVFSLATSYDHMDPEEGELLWKHDVIPGRYEIPIDLLDRYFRVMEEFEEVQIELAKAQQKVHKEVAKENTVVNDAAYHKAQARIK